MEKKTKKPKANAKANVTASSREADTLAEVKPRIRIKLRAYDHKVTDTAARQIVDTALRNNAEVHGPVPLPTEFHRYTVNRSTFVHKDARDQFEMRAHRRLIDISSPTPKLIDALTALTLPSGVDIEIKTL